MRRTHRLIGLFFAPFLLSTALTGLLWAYAPYLYLKKAPGPGPAAMIDEKAAYLPVVDVIHAALSLKEGRVKNLSLRPESDRIIYSVNVISKGGLDEIWVDAKTGEVTRPVRSGGSQFHAWVMKIHRLEFFGTKKELTAIPGLGLVLLIGSGLLIWKNIKRRDHV